MGRFRAPRAEEIENLAAEYAKLAGATFTGDVDAPTLKEGGSDLSNLYALLSGATFTGGIDVGHSQTGAMIKVNGEGVRDHAFAEFYDDVERVAYLGKPGSGLDWFGLVVEAGLDFQIRADGLVMIRDSSTGGSSEAVAEYGSNSNGEYVRFYNGVQVCWHEQDFNAENVDVNLEGSRYFTEQLRWDYPVAFASTPLLAIPKSVPVTDISTFNLALLDGGPGTDFMTYRVHADQQLDAYFDVMHVAIGTW